MANLKVSFLKYTLLKKKLAYVHYNILIIITQLLIDINSKLDYQVFFFLVDS